MRGSIAILLLLPLITGHSFDETRESTINIAFSRETDFIDRLHTDSMESAALSLAVYDTLLYRNPQSGSIEGLLAESWSWNAARDAVEMILRKDVRFHNGEKFDAEDVIYTINLLTDPANNIHFRQREFSFGFIKNVEKLSRYRIVVHLKRATPLAEQILATRLHIWPQTYTRDHGGHMVHRTEPIGTGPYRVTALEPGKEIRLEANHEYFDGAKPRAGINQFIVKTVPNLQTQIAQLLKGSLDFIWGLPADHARFLKKYPELTVTYGESARITFLSLNASGRGNIDILTNISIRKAIAHSINRELIARNLMPASAVPLYYQCHPSQDNCLAEPRPEYLAFDPGRAKTLLTEAGYEGPISLEIIFGSDELRKVGEAIQWQLQQIGIDISLRTFTLPAWRKKFLAGESVISVLSFGADLYDVAATLPQFFSFGPADYARDPMLARMIDQAIETTDSTRRQKLFERALLYISDKSYTVPLYTNPVSFIFHNDLSYDPGTLPFPDVTRLRPRNYHPD